MLPKSISDFFSACLVGGHNGVYIITNTYCFPTVSNRCLNDDDEYDDDHYIPPPALRRFNF